MAEPIVDPKGLSTEAEEASWFDDLHEDFKAEKSLDVFSKDKEGLNNVVKSYLETKKKQGNAIWLPGDDAKPEDVTDFRKKLGIPESADKYDIKYKEHEALKFDENTDKAWKSKAHEIGLTPKQAQSLTDYYADMLIGTREAQGKEYNAAIEEVKAEFGNDYQNVLDKANNVLRTFADAKDMETVKAYENDVRLVRLLAKVGDAMSEHTLKIGDKGTVASTKDDYLKKAQEQQMIYLDDSKPMSERKRANAEAQKWYGLVYGDKEVSGSNEM